LYSAANEGDLATVKFLLETNPGLNINWQSKEEKMSWTALHRACSNGHDGLVALLLAHPDIDVNQRDIHGNTPFRSACTKGRWTCVRLLLRDSRVMVNVPDVPGSTPLRGAVFHRHLLVVKWMIASGRRLDLGIPGDKRSDLIAIARTEGITEAYSLLTGFRDTPDQVREEVKHELKISGQYDVITFLRGGAGLNFVLCF